MLTSPKLILPFQIARIQKYFEAQVRFAWHRDVDLPVLGSAGCQPAAFGTLPNATRFRQAAGNQQASSLCSPDKKSYAATSSCWREIPRSSNKRINVSSIRLFGQE